MNMLRGFFKREEGLSLIELLVVVAIMGILATLTAVAVTGTTSKTKGSTKDNDQVTVTNAVSAYSGEHPQGRSPTFDGCTPQDDGGLKTLTKTCEDTGVAQLQKFLVNEADFGVDVDGQDRNTDGIADNDTAVPVVPIIWDQRFTGDDTKVKAFNLSFVDEPKHAFDLVDGTSVTTWKGSSGIGGVSPTGDRPEDDLQLPSLPDISKCTTASGDCPVWVLNEFGEAKALLPGSVY